MRSLWVWFYLVASMHGLSQGQAPVIRQVGPFETAAACWEAKRAENPSLWKSESCYDENSEAVTFPIAGDHP